MASGVTPSRITIANDETGTSVRQGGARRPAARIAGRAGTFVRQTNPHLLLALALTLVYHGTLLVRTFYGTYDALIHMFFADHYARSWFDPWDPRWYTGFTVTSYPPGSHQSIALLSQLIGLRGGFFVVQLGALLFAVLGVYRFSKLWVSEEAAGYAALLAVFSTSLIETVHIYGQLPTMFSLGFLLNSLPYARRWLVRGGIGALVTAWAVAAACTAGHHVTTLFGAVFFIGPVIASLLLDSWFRPLPGEPADSGRSGGWRGMLAVRWRRVFGPLVRTAVFGVGLIAILLVVIAAYWFWSFTDPITQVSIPHPSRDSYFVNINAGIQFWLIPYGVAALALPYVLWRSLASRAWPLGLGLALLTLLGTGGTTPIPRLILGEAYDILTMERFTFWSTIIMLPFLGEFVVSLRRGRIAVWISLGFGTVGLRLAQTTLLIAYLGAAMVVATFPVFRPIEPAAIDMRPLVDFLEKDQHWRYRYLTLGFGDQQAWLAAQTTALSVDGDYHSARRLPELTTEPVGTLDSAKYLGVGGLNSLRQILGMPEKYNLNYVFSNDRFYDPLLYLSGWQRVERLENGVVVWERGDVPPVPEVLPRRDISPWLRLLWGVAPMTAIALALLALSARWWSPLLGRLLRYLGLGWPRSWQRWARERRMARRARRLSKWAPSQAANGLPPAATAPNRFVALARRFRSFPVPVPTARQASVGVLLLLLAGSASGVALWQQREDRAREPLAIVQGYYQELDFRYFDRAWGRLDPQTRPTFEQFRLDRSLEGGLVASYGKLDKVAARIVASEPDRLEVQSDLTWLTALGNYPTTARLTLVRRDGDWYIAPQTKNEVLPPDQFFRRPAVDWRSQGRRRATIGTTDYEDILDRPDIQVLSARLVQANGRYSIVGEVLNRDNDPAEVNVTAILYDQNGGILGRYNAQVAAAHRLFPKEIAPFRVDFDSIAAAGLTAGDGTGPGQIAGFSVQARSLVLVSELGRELSVQGLRAVTGSDGQLRLVGQVVNTGTQEATIPHLVFTYYDASGQVAWVDSRTLPASIRPERAQEFELPVPPVSAQRTVNARGEVAANGLAAPLPAPTPPTGAMPLPPGSGYASVSVTVDYFVGTRP